MEGGSSMAEEKKSEGMQMLEMKGIIGMLKATAGTAEHLRLTGGPAQGSPAAVRQYNAVVKRLGSIIPEDLFTPLEEDASFVDLGMCCEQLAAYLESLQDDTGEKKPVTPKIQGPVSIKIGDLGELKNLGEVVRQAMPPWLREQMEKDKSKEAGEVKGETEGDMNDLESRIAELGAQMQALAERMRREELSSDEIRKLADEMRQLGQQQSELAKRHAAIRSHKGAGDASD
jgi:hypothetical protein